MKQVPIVRSQILITATQNSVAQATWYPGFVHSCNTAFFVLTYRTCLYACNLASNKLTITS
jgi:hypothetical protein